MGLYDGLGVGLIVGLDANNNISDPASTLLYIRKSAMAPLKYASLDQALLPK